ncbi:type II secretion system F family protein [Mumia sp. zg.B53]|uniref:type II secretion system F family protein n=1 Tax=unclassified Mumia TaxID=2621872 RepID=UPI001C6F18CA|nr:MULTISPECIES: type II secretion system F family protein [unclassified Mumia]MBW9207408.1 type II secretion system F family protein [Mumia sp. zg.B17]MBW9210251.1 type II secretion system F family protein [Mumia sp. zg.B21]MBW9214861.1 type II secretion system F family protein [Mumia sp. zg.B53]MDD9348106.1 type II secretion system F family protein [Mumia sp.]
MSVVAGLLAWWAVSLACDTPRTGRLRALPLQTDAGSSARVRPGWVTAPWFAGMLATAAVLLVVGGTLGLVAGAVTGGGVTWWIRRLEPAAVRRRREAEIAALPVALDLVVAAIESGRPSNHALELVGGAVGGPLGERLAGVAVRLEIGSDPVTVWRELVDDPVLAPLARAFARASRSGTPVGRSLVRSADDLRASAAAQALERARSVGVRTAAPLGACFLPAFLLLGVVPTIVSTFTSLQL